MSLKKMFISGAAAFALVGTAALAAVSVEKDGTGDYLLTPVYYAAANWSTTLKVVNTNTTKAVVAKVVLRDAKSSQEVFDFMIYLTPGDVWEGTIFDDNGYVKLKSTDDSMIIGGRVASRSNPIVIGGKKLVEKDTYKDATQKTIEYIKRTNWHGYVEIVGVAAYDANMTAAAIYKKKNGGDLNGYTEWKPCDPIDKAGFYSVIKDGSDLVVDLGVVSDNRDKAQDVTNDDLMGKATIYAEDSDVNGRRAMMLNMLALGDFTLGNPVEVLSGVYAADTTLENMTQRAYTDYGRVIAEMDAALAKDRIYVMYEGDGENLYPIRTHFTVPTKKYWFKWYSNKDSTITMPSVYDSDDIDAASTPGNLADEVKESFEWYYTINTDTTKVTFRDRSENCNKCQKTEGEISGFYDTTDCTIKIHEEVHFFQNTKAKGVEYHAEDPIKEYAFKDGGYIDFDLSGLNYVGYYAIDPQFKTKATDHNVTFKGMPIVPTTFYAKNVQGIFLNNWLYNQYRKADATVK